MIYGHSQSQEFACSHWGALWDIMVWWGQVSKTDLLCTVMNPKEVWIANDLFTQIKSQVFLHEITYKWFRQCHPFYLSNSHSDYKIITNQFVFLAFADLKKELRELLTANKWRLKLPNSLVQQLQTRLLPSTHGSYLCNNCVTMPAVSQDPSRSCHVEKFQRESKRFLGKSY